MEVQQQQQQQQLGLGLGLGLGFREQDATSSSSLVVGLKLCLPLPSKLTESDVKTENPIQLNNYPNRVSDKSPEALKHAPKILDVSPSGGTRWNPTSEQIAALEALYIGGMRTPSAQVIERITFDLGKYGRIEGKNVFYWFQNHKARERQKQKRSSLLTLAATTTTTTITASQCRGKEVKEWCDPSKKRRCGNWKAQVSQENDGSDGTLELFPLHPEL